MRCGKSLPASIWINHPCRVENTFIITKKQNKQDWIDLKTKATVVTKEEFKKTKIIKPTAIVVDEAHNFGSQLFTKGRSALASKLYNLVREYPDCHVLLLTATPVRNDAWSLHTLLTYVGIYYPWKEWRDRFFELKRMPFLRFPAYFPKKDWREKIKPILEKHTDIVSLKDVVEYLPPANTRIVNIKQSKYVRPEDETVTWTDEHRYEQKGKAKEIIELGYKRVIVVAHYTQQIDELAKELSEYKPVYILDGRTKNADEVKRQAQEAEECYFIVQASCGEGWDGWMFGCLVFVSMSHSCVAHTQMFGRQRHPGHLKTTETIYIIGGRWDERIYDCVTNGRNFDPHVYLND